MPRISSSSDGLGLLALSIYSSSPTTTLTHGSLSPISVRGIIALHIAFPQNLLYPIKQPTYLRT